MNYEAFREQCANICENAEYVRQYGDNEDNINWKDVCAKAIRALPLPEVNYETARKEFEKWVVNQGVAMDYRGDGIYGNPTVRRWHEGFIAATELGFCGNANTEALRKENEQLKHQIAELELDANRYKFLRDNVNNELYLTRNQQAAGYRSAKDYIEAFPKNFEDVKEDELQVMIDTNTIWHLQIYPNNPVSFYFWAGASLDSIVDAAMKDGVV